MQPPFENEVRHWLDRLLSGAGEDRVKAASELSRLGVWTRGSVRTRGSLCTPADNRLPDPERLAEVINLLQDENPPVRCAVASALGEWGGEQAAFALSQMLQSERDEEVQLCCVAALRKIGGLVAADGLGAAAERGQSESVRDSAITAISELATGGPVEDSEGPAMARPARPRGAVAVGGSVRARGSARSADVMDRIVSTLQGIQTDEAASQYLRLRAGEALEHLGR